MSGQTGAFEPPKNVPPLAFSQGAQWLIAGWSSPVARQAHNLKVASSNLAPATTFVITHSPSRSNRRDGFGFLGKSEPGGSTIRMDFRRKRAFCRARSIDGSRPATATLTSNDHPTPTLELLMPAARSPGRMRRLFRQAIRRRSSKNCLSASSDGYGSRRCFARSTF